MIQKNFIRYFATLILGCLLFSQAYAQHITEFRFSETAPDNIRNIMQTNAEAVFAEINRACEQNTALSLLPANITDEASKRIMTMWIVSHFYCIKTNIKEMVLKSSNGYQVRNIPVFIEKGDKPEDKYHDMVIEFNESGKISDLIIALSQYQHARIMDSSNDASDLRHRRMISEFIENFRTAYNRKDLPYIEKVFSDKGVYTENLSGYIKNLKRAFASNSYINIKFDEIIVRQDEGNPNFYGINLKQEFTVGDYHDAGWFFFKIDYENENNPLIWVCTWQPLKDPNTGKEIHYNNDKIFGLEDFPMSK